MTSIADLGGELCLWFNFNGAAPEVLGSRRGLYHAAQGVSWAVLIAFLAYGVAMSLLRLGDWGLMSAELRRRVTTWFWNALVVLAGWLFGGLWLLGARLWAADGWRGRLLKTNPQGQVLLAPHLLSAALLVVQAHVGLHFFHCSPLSDDGGVPFFGDFFAVFGLLVLGFRFWTIVKYQHEADEPWMANLLRVGATQEKRTLAVEVEPLRLVSPIEWLGMATRLTSGWLMHQHQWPSHDHGPELVMTLLASLATLIFLPTLWHLALSWTGLISTTVSELEQQIAFADSWLGVLWPNLQSGDLNMVIFYLLVALQIFCFYYFAWLAMEDRELRWRVLVGGTVLGGPIGLAVMALVSLLYSTSAMLRQEVQAVVGLVTHLDEESLLTDTLNISCASVDTRRLHGQEYEIIP